ncbi:AraC family transcriptional regulator [Enterococcus xiangfangensis]|uniref:AraC family transcriptional regulator n=1 Tax=Enterococcus xiangfangensis TaxID=1296537 RepID=A0ABU3F7R0_9ENTE|nr:AraC family transcriptional regulator [Enterococcus xiangfangensis]MDT2758703.1 AraC family transcriptional regulator [Enterococcus xiangfangensis]
MHKIVEDYLHHHNQVEKAQLNKKKFIMDIPTKSFQTSENNIVLLKEYFLKNNSIYISKHPRFAPYPEHSHHFLELNYVYSGKSVQYINGNCEVIQQGEILLLDRGSSHSLSEHGENDILINIIFPNDKVDIDWLSSLNEKNSVLFNFLAQTIATRSRKEYLIFRCSENQHVQMILDQIIDKHFSEPVFANEIISLYIPILFTELIGNCQYDFYQEKKDKTNHQVIIDTLKLIESDYAILSLESAAKKLGYNKNYLSNIVKKKTNQTFSELLAKQRMKQAKFLIENSSLSISAIIEIIGLKNRSHFYQQFKTTYGVLPNTFRE